MDSVRAFGEDAAYSAADDEPAMDAPPEIGVDERRMHVRAYNYWVSLLEGRAYPSISDLEPNTLGDFGPNSVLLDFSGDTTNPRVCYLGKALRSECDLIGDIRHIADVPKRSLLSRLTDHYLQIIANSAPIGFEAEFVGQRGHNTMYRGILMPFTSTGETIDFIYGVINWKEVADQATANEIAREAERALASACAESSPIWADGPNAEPLDRISAAASARDDWNEPELELDDDAELADRLSAARECAEAARSSDARSRASLYRALGHAYDFALHTERDPQGYGELLEDYGLKAQARAPMTPVVKLVFGADYDKARLTEFAASLCWARREGLPMGGFHAYLDSFEGGLKGMVAAERQARRPEPRADLGEAARRTVRSRGAVAWLDMDTGTEEFVLLLARRESGRLAVVEAVEDPKMVDKALKKAAA
ncbi:MAG TPA: hypothetical protein VGB62_05055 [Allosphingosinicella sp.]|jgi:hypothetical protein